MGEQLRHKSKSVPYKLSTTNDKFTSRSGLILITEVMQQMDVDNLANRHFPVAGSNRGFSAATYIQVFVLMLLEGGRCLENIRHLKADSDLLSMLGMKRLPGASHFKLVTFTSAQVGIIHPALTNRARPGSCDTATAVVFLCTSNPTWERFETSAARQP